LDELSSDFCFCHKEQQKSVSRVPTRMRRREKSEPTLGIVNFLSLLKGLTFSCVSSISTVVETFIDFDVTQEQLKLLCTVLYHTVRRRTVL
jgi:hypothetical protein